MFMKTLTMHKAEQQLHYRSVFAQEPNVAIYLNCAKQQ